MPLKFYNTLTKKKEDFVPLVDKKVGMYVCGITPYDYCHLGHGRCYTVFDAIRRYLAWKGYEVTFVQNFTDIDDKIINRARETGDDPVLLAKRFSDEYFVEADALGIMRADKYPKVTEHVEDIVALAQKLVDIGIAYETDDGVYYDVSKFPKYGKLSGQPLENLLAGARITPTEQKKNPGDFALWKKAKPGEPSWPSPWGEGRPGWHVECSAMSMKYLGETFDIHGGGQDLIFPHHEDEVAQSEGATGKQFVKYWLHNGFIVVGKDKMAKSLGNFKTLRGALDKHGGQVLRFFYLQSHYREPVDATDENINKSSEALQKILGTLSDLQAELENGNTEGESIQNKIDDIKEKFTDAMDDDFNTPLAITAIFELKDLAQKAISEKNYAATRECQKTLLELLGILGIPEATGKKIKITDEEIHDKVKQRDEAREKKNFALSDAIRKALLEKGIILEDSNSKTKWKRKA